MKAAVLQLSAQGMSSTKLYNYIRIAHKNGVKVLLLGEYTLNPFFHELKTLSASMIQEQALHQIKVLKELANSYDITIVTPLVVVKKEKIYKTVAKFSPNGAKYYFQQLLINYPHWNEEKFFANPKSTFATPLIFTVNGFRFSILSGFELHFDEAFRHIDEKNIDCLLVPSVSTFDSYERWKSLILTRAFTHNCYILRANRIGEYADKEHIWQFYGDSLLASPDGELVEHLGNKEELMIVDMQRSAVAKSKKIWGFRRKTDS